MSAAVANPGTALTAAALAASRESIRVHSKSFALASRLLPRRARDRAVVVYAWCRRADDAVDLAARGQGRLALVDLRRELDAIYGSRRLDDPIVAAFQQVARESRIPRLYPEELLAGLEMDLRLSAYDSLPRLLLYAYRVAGTVGLMMCHVMGLRDEGATRNAVHLGVAMQLTNICRDVAEDWQRQRLYLPADLLQSHGCADLATRLGGPFPHAARHGVACASGELLDQASAYYRSGAAGIPSLSWRCGLAVRTASRVYAAIGARIRAQGCDPLAGRAWVGRAAKLGLTARATLEMLSWRAGPNRGGVLQPPRHEVRAEDVLPVQGLLSTHSAGVSWHG